MLHNLFASTSVLYVFFQNCGSALTVFHVVSRATMLLRTIIINELHNGQWYDSSTEALLHVGNMQLCNCAHRCHYTQPGGHTVAYKRALTVFKLHSCLTQHVNVGKLCLRRLLQHQPGSSRRSFQLTRRPQANLA